MEQQNNTTDEHKRIAYDINQSQNSTEGDSYFSSHSGSSSQMDNDLSVGWKRIFSIFDRLDVYHNGYGAKNSPSLYKSLSFSEKFAISFSIWGFFFGALYYLVKKMYLKAALYMSAVFFVVAVVELIFIDVLKTDLPVLLDNLLTYGAAGFFAVMAKYDYYMFRRYNIKYVRVLPDIFKNSWFVLLVFLVSLWLCFFCI